MVPQVVITTKRAAATAATTITRVLIGSASKAAELSARSSSGGRNPAPPSGVDGRGARACRRDQQEREAEHDGQLAAVAAQLRVERPEAGAGPTLERRPVLIEVRERHLAGGDERRERVNSPATISRPRTNSISPANQNGQVPVGTAVPIGQPNTFIEPCSVYRSPNTIRKVLRTGEE